MLIQSSRFLRIKASLSHCCSLEPRAQRPRSIAPRARCRIVDFRNAVQEAQDLSRKSTLFVSPLSRDSGQMSCHDATPLPPENRYGDATVSLTSDNQRIYTS